MTSDRFWFFVSGEANRVFPGTPLWKVLLSGENNPGSRHPFSGAERKDSAITIGDYFSACRRFLSKNNFSVLKTGLGALLTGPVNEMQIDRISVSLEKHGAFYHPLKVQVVLCQGGVCSFVLNGAVSRPGLSLIEKEYQLISGLNTAFLKRYLPRVFGVDIMKTDKGRVGFFLGEWFEGYREFHVTQGQEGRQVVIWESDGRCEYISETRALPIYQEIARILTYYYDIETCRQISAWHHAAGDFIIKRKKGRIQIRLVTVRDYSPVTEFCTADENKKVSVLPCLLFFFLNLTFRMRLDRINGTGEGVILEKSVIKASVEGFLKGLEEKSNQYDYGDLRSVFFEFFNQFSMTQMLEMMVNILDVYPSSPVERGLIEKNLESHSRAVYSICRNI